MGELGLEVELYGMKEEEFNGLSGLIAGKSVIKNKVRFWVEWKDKQCKRRWIKPENLKLKTKECDWCSRLNTGKYFNKSISSPESFLCEQCHVFECANQSLPELDSEEKIDSNSRESQALKKIITLDDLLQGKWKNSMCQHFEVYDN